MTTRRFASVDYSKLPAPDAIEAWAHQAILDARMADFVARWTAARAKDPSLPPYTVAPLETDPVVIVEQTDAWREGLVRQRINDAIRATYLASAQGADLVARAAEYLTAPAAGESAESLRARAQLAWENLSIGGSYGGYAYQARSVAPADIADVAVWGYEVASPDLFGDHAILSFPKGEVRIVVLGNTDTGAPAAGLVARVQAALSDRARRKVNDNINVVSATLRPHIVDATLVLRRGAVPQDMIAAARKRVAAYGAMTRLVGVEATRGGYLAALMADQPGLVVDVDLRAPAGPVGGGPCEAPVLTGAHLDWRHA